MMSFRTNLQYLRAQRNMTQERLAMLLGVSRQAISKWESEKAYPEMDKLLMICDLFGCTLDDLVLGDVSVSTSRPDSHGASATGCGTTVGGRTGEDAGSPAHAGNAIMLMLYSVAVFSFVTAEYGTACSTSTATTRRPIPMARKSVQPGMISTTI